MRTQNVLSHIDFSAAFDTVLHKFMDITLAKERLVKQSRAIFRAIYAVASGISRVNDTDGEYVFSDSFNACRCVIQRRYYISSAFYFGTGCIDSTIRFSERKRVQMRAHSTLGCLRICRWCWFDCRIGWRHDKEAGWQLLRMQRGPMQTWMWACRKRSPIMYTSAANWKFQDEAKAAEQR